VIELADFNMQGMPGCAHVQDCFVTCCPGAPDLPSLIVHCKKLTFNLKFKQVLPAVCERDHHSANAKRECVIDNVNLTWHEKDAMMLWTWEVLQ
jgi:hypothetical protein